MALSQPHHQPPEPRWERRAGHVDVVFDGLDSLWAAEILRGVVDWRSAHGSAWPAGVLSRTLASLVRCGLHRAVDGMTQPHAQTRTPKEHRAIYRAITSREPDIARSCAAVHISAIESWPVTTLTD